jgi:hypothetical protein
VLSREATNTNVMVFGFTQPELEPMINIEDFPMVISEIILFWVQLEESNVPSYSI